MGDRPRTPTATHRPAASTPYCGTGMTRSLSAPQTPAYVPPMHFSFFPWSSLALGPGASSPLRPVSLSNPSCTELAAHRPSKRTSCRRTTPPCMSPLPAVSAKPRPSSSMSPPSTFIVISDQRVCASLLGPRARTALLPAPLPEPPVALPALPADDPPPCPPATPVPSSPPGPHPPASPRPLEPVPSSPPVCRCATPVPSSLPGLCPPVAGLPLDSVAPWPPAPS